MKHKKSVEVLKDEFKFSVEYPRRLDKKLTEQEREYLNSINEKMLHCFSYFYVLAMTTPFNLVRDVMVDYWCDITSQIYEESLKQSKNMADEYLQDEEGSNEFLNNMKDLIKENQKNT